jgi:signal peptidase II
MPRLKLYIFNHQDLQKAPEWLVETNLRFLANVLLQDIFEYPYGEAHRMARAFLRNYTYKRFLEDELPLVDKNEIPILLSTYAYIRNASTFLVPEQQVKKGEIYLLLQRKVNVIEGFFDLTYIENPGAAWGFLSQANRDFRRVFFLIVSLLAIAVLTFLLYRLEADRTPSIVGFSLIYGGALGNFYDRLRYNYVIDFVEWHWYDKMKWPTYNIADLAIVFGVAIILLTMFFRRPASQTQETQ